MHDSPTKTRRLPRLVVMAIVAMLAATGFLVGTAAPAAADSGSSNALWIRMAGQTAIWQQWARGERSGTYHVHFWDTNGSWNVNGPNYFYDQTTRNRSIPAPVPVGHMICAELWYHVPGGGYESWGLPCVRMSS